MPASPPTASAAATTKIVGRNRLRECSALAIGADLPLRMNEYPAFTFDEQSGVCPQNREAYSRLSGQVKTKSRRKWVRMVTATEGLLPVRDPAPSVESEGRLVGAR